jgi:hypothetical protein
MKRSLALSFVLLASACPNDNTTSEAGSAVEAADSAEVASSESQVLSLTVDNTDMAAPSGLRATPTADQIANYAFNHIGDNLTPSTCHSATINGTTVTYTFTDCTGPRGLVHFSGTLVVDYSIDVNGIHAHATGNGVTANGATLDVDATATYTVANGTKSLSVTTMGNATGPNGTVFTRNGDYTVTWTATCFTLDGSWMTTVGNATSSTTVTGLSRCLGKCPASGGTISHTFLNNVTLTITFDGSATAQWSTSNGKSGTVNLLCTP